VADDIYTQRLSLCAASKVLPIGNRAELRRWRGEAAKVLAQPVTPAQPCRRNACQSQGGRYGCLTELDSAERSRRTTPEAAAAKVETSFEQLVGRPSRERRVLEHRHGPRRRRRDFECTRGQLAEATECAVENVRAACAAAAHEEVAAVRCELVAKGAEASVDLAHKPADNPLRIHQVGGAFAAVVPFGTPCVHAGHELWMTWVPSWVHPAQAASNASRAPASVLSVAAG